MKIADTKVLITLGLVIIAQVSLCFGAVNYDTAWTFIYREGKDKDGSLLINNIRGVAAASDGCWYCVGVTGDTAYSWQTLLIKLDSNGKKLWEKKYVTKNSANARFDAQSGYCLYVRDNGDIIIGGERYSNPLIMCTDSLGNLKWSTWYYDSTANRSKLSRTATINSIRETSRGTFVCAVGDKFPDNNGFALRNYGGFLEFDQSGTLIAGNEWDDETGWALGGFSIETFSDNKYIVAGNQGVRCTKTDGTILWTKKYSFFLEGVGSVTNNVNKVKRLRDGTLMIAGQAYEGNCWTRYKTLYYDAWWTPINAATGANTDWDTAGIQGRNDVIFDFTQLSNGNLVFVGSEDYNATLGGIYTGLWAIITDSTGKSLLGNKLVGGPIDGGMAVSVAAGRDSSFAAVGKLGRSGFVAKLIPKPESTAIAVNMGNLPLQVAQCRIEKTRVIFNVNPGFTGSSISVNITNAKGARVATVKNRFASNNTISWDFTGVPGGLYFYQVENVPNAQGKFVLR